MAAAEEQAAAEQLRRLDVLERALESRAADEQDDRRAGRRRQGGVASGAAGGGDTRARRDRQRPRCHHRPDTRCADAHAPPGQRACRRARRVERRTRRHGDTEASARYPRAARTERRPRPSRSTSRSRSKRMPRSMSISPTSRQCGFAAGDERRSRRWSRWSSGGSARSRRILRPPSVKDLDALAAKVEEARALDASIVAKDAELEALAGSACVARRFRRLAARGFERGDDGSCRAGRCFARRRSPPIWRRSAQTRPMR